MTSDLQKKVNVLVKEICEQTARISDIATELAIAAELQKFEPRAFSHGKCSIGAKCVPPFNATWYIVLGNGEKIERNALDVPMHLWPAGLRATYEKLSPYQRPKLRA